MKNRVKVFTTLLFVIVMISESLFVSFASETEGYAGQQAVQSIGQDRQNLAEETADGTAQKAYNGPNAKRIPIITYHRIVTDAQKKKIKYKGSSLAISKSTFDKQMKWLHKKGYRTINCEEFYLWYKGEIKLPKKTVMITFDDGFIGVADNALPVLQKYNMKATSFIIGSSTKKNKKKAIGYNRMLQIQRNYPNLEFQSHTYNLHKKNKRNISYKKALSDAITQKSTYGFKYLAYPYGRYTSGMIKANKEAGIKMAFTYGKNGYATRKQNPYKIRRIKISSFGSFSKFKNWFK